MVDTTFSNIEYQLYILFPASSCALYIMMYWFIMYPTPAQYVAIAQTDRQTVCVALGYCLTLLYEYCSSTNLHMPM